MVQLALFLLLFFGAKAAASITFCNQSSTVYLTGANASLAFNAKPSNWSGTLQVDSLGAATVTSSSIATTPVFSQGVVRVGYNSFTTTGTYSGTNPNTLILGAGDQLEALSDKISQAVLIKGTVATPSVIRGQPLFGSTLTLNDATSALQLVLSNKLDVSPALNGGTISLGANLALLDGVFFSGNGTINCNNYSLVLPEVNSSSWSGNLTFAAVREIRLTGYTKVTGTWTFGDAAGFSIINGCGNVLDLTGGGNIVVASNHTLYLNDVSIRGLSTTGGKFTINLVGGTVRLQNSVLELAGQYSHTSGQIYVYGARTSQLLCANSTSGTYSFDVSSTGTLTVDHSILEYEVLGGQNLSPITYTNFGTQQNLINGGLIRSTTADPNQANLIFDVAAVSPQLYKNYFLTSLANLIFTNSLGGAQSMTFSANGYSVIFPRSGTGMLQLANNLSVTLTNIVLRDYLPAIVQLGSSANLYLGDNSVVSLSQAITLSASAKLVFTGNSTLEGNGQSIYLTAAQCLTINGASKTLEIKNARIVVQNATGLACLANTSKITLTNCVVIVESTGMTFGVGNMDVGGDTRIVGCNSTSPTALSTFTFSSGGALRILANSLLAISGNVNFTYSPDVTVNSDTLSASKRHLTLVDSSALLMLDNCSLTTTATGMALDKGRVLVRDNVTVNISTSPLATFDIGSALDLYIEPGASFTLTGPTTYNSTTYP